MANREIEVTRRRRPEQASAWHPLASLHDDMERLFSRYLPRQFSSAWIGEDGSVISFAQVDVSESDDAVDVTVDLPGVSEKDIEVTLSDDSLSVKGDRKTEAEEKGKNFHRIERSYGAFQRRIALPCAIDEKGVTATVKNGLLKVHLPKSAEAKSKERVIKVKSQ